MKEPSNTRSAAIKLLFLGFIAFGIVTIANNRSVENGILSRPEGAQQSLAVELIQATKLSDVIKEKSAKKKLVVIYTTWCPYCKRQMPELAKLASDDTARNLQIILVALDGDENKVRQFLARYNIAGARNYLISEETRQSMPSVMFSHQAAFDGSIPYGALFDEEGNIIKQYKGFVDAFKVDEDLSLPALR